MLLALVVLAAAEVRDVCLSVAEKALAAEDHSAVAVEACAQQRPADGFWLPNAAEDCEQFGAMLRLAVHLAPRTTSAEFCADVGGDVALAAHSRCMKVADAAFGAAGVKTAFEAACASARGEACSLFAAESLQSLNSRKACDLVVTNGTGSWAVRAPHIQYSCVQFAENCAADAACAHSAAPRCEQGKSSAAFCAGFAGLVRDLQTGSGDAAAFCKEHANVTREPVATVKSDPDRVMADCVDHTKQMLQLGLPSEELGHVANEVCEKKYSAAICGNFTSLVAKAAVDPASSALHDACRIAVSQNPFDMNSVCRQAVAKVDETELAGDAFKKASFEVCAQLLEHEKKSVDPTIADGCTYFSEQLASARTGGTVTAEIFCKKLTADGDDSKVSTLQKIASSASRKHPSTTSLVERKVLLRKHVDPLEPAKPTAPSVAEPAAAPAAAKPVAAAFASPAPAVATGDAAKVKASAAGKASAEDEAYLSTFLDAYDAKTGSSGPLLKRVQDVFPETKDSQSTNVDNVISDFLSGHDA